ncbi:MAG: MATE family efflux transporter [SAR202 cluster bacterium]|nr:MATE family efflux transporter [SAR202 cluster bacterium]
MTAYEGATTITAVGHRAFCGVQSNVGGLVDSIKIVIKDRWERQNGYRQILVIAIPLILSTGSWSVKLFVDRVLLSWYSSDALAAALPAGMLNFALMSLFIGTAGYTSTFVAQYYGAERFQRIGPTVWQGFYVAIFGGAVLIALIPFAGKFFAFAGHDPAVAELEVTYFRILCLGAMPAIASAAMAGFFSGRGQTWPVLWVNVISAGVNIALDYVLIFGYWGFPELGMTGAAIATIVSSYVQLLIYIALLQQPTHKVRYNALKGWRFDRILFTRLMRFGFPNGLQFFIEMIGFAAFVLFMGRLGTISLAGSNLAFNINMLAFMPMIGVGIGVSVVVGQSLGSNRPDLAGRGVATGFHIAFLYIATVAALYAFVPNVFLAPYAARIDTESFAPIRSIAVVALRFVAVYSLFDTLSIVYSSALKGAGDTRFVMLMLLVLSLLGLVLPSYIALVILNAGVYVGWSILTAYVVVTGFAFLIRYRGAKWKSMRVIEEAARSPSTSTT